MSIDAPPAPMRTMAPRPLGPVRRTVREVGLALITAGVVILLFVAYQLFGTNLTEARNQAALKRSFSTEMHARTPAPRPAPATSPTGDPSTVGAAASPTAGDAGALDHMTIPKLGLDKYVVDGTSEADLSRGPGHYPGTPYPGQPGNVGIAGHRTTYGAPFYRLDQLGVGDDILLTDTTGTTWRYQVDQPALVVAPSDVAVLDPTPAATLTLTTCNPRFSATSRLVVKARLVGRATPATPAAPAGAPTAPVATAPAPTAPAPSTAATPASLTGGNHSAWPAAILYGALVVLAWVATRVGVNRTRRWSRAGAFVGGVAVCCVPLWLCFENVVRLLPQSI